MGPRRSDLGELVVRAGWSLYPALRGPVEARFPFRSPAAIERVQGRRVRRTIAHAYEHVPHYRETMGRLGLRPADFRRAADLARLPLLERGQLQRDPERFVSRAQPIDRYVKRRTGGSSGEPLTVYTSRFALFEVAAHRERHRSILARASGKRVHIRQALIKGSGLEQETSRSYRRLSLVPPSIRTVDRRLSMLDTPARNVELLNEFRPEVLRSFGSYLAALFLHLQRTGEAFHRPSAVVYGGDAMPEPVRRLVSDTFGIPVFGAYGAGEAFQIGFECERHGGFHLNADLYPVRIVDDEGREVPDGESGEVVVSNLVNRGTVLLNYRLGDVAAKLPGGCACGRTLPMLSFVEGRVDDWLDSRSGEPVHSQAVRTLFTPEEEVYGYQVVQRSPSEFAVAVVGSARLDRDGLRGRLARRFTDRFGEGTGIEVSFVDSLPRTAAGKVRAVVRGS